ncbi:MAG: hypothetical protein WAM24_08280 [Ignavibacteriaceae bacterium]
MNNDSLPLTKEEIFRMYEQSELSEIINDEIFIYKRIQNLKTIKNKIPVIYILVSAGVLAGAVSFLSLVRKNKLF